MITEGTTEGCTDPNACNPQAGFGSKARYSSMRLKRLLRILATEGQDNIRNKKLVVYDALKNGHVGFIDSGMTGGVRRYVI